MIDKEVDLIRQQFGLHAIRYYMLIFSIGFLEALYLFANPITMPAVSTSNRHINCRCSTGIKP